MQNKDLLLEAVGGIQVEHLTDECVLGGHTTAGGHGPHEGLHVARGGQNPMHAAEFRPALRWLMAAKVGPTIIGGRLLTMVVQNEGHLFQVVSHASSMDPIVLLHLCDVKATC